MTSCEWCGRPGTEIQLHVYNEERCVEFGVPTLCDVCSGLLGFFSDPETPSTADPGFQEFMERRVAETQDAAREKLFLVLTENYARRGKPIPVFMARGGGSDSGRPAGS